MKRSASSTFEAASAGYRSATPSPTRQDDDLAGNADAIDRTAEEENQHVPDTGPGHTAPMPFPGPYAHDPVPAVVVRFGPVDNVAVPAPVNTSGVTDASTTATRPVARTDAPPGDARPGATRTEHPETSPLSADEDANPDGLPPLILAAKHGNLDQLRALLKQPGVDIDQVDTRFGSTAMMFAAQAGNLDVVEFLLAMRADVNFRNPVPGNTALIVASIAGRLDMVNVLLKRRDIRLEQTNNYGVYALAAAAQNGHADIVNALLDADADVNFRDPQYEQTALMSASAAGKLDVVNVLLKRPGMRIEQTSNKRGYALVAAAQYGRADIVNALLDAGADVNFRDPQNGDTALIFASATGKLGVVSLLLKRPGVRLEEASNNGMYALACAAEYGHVDIVNALLDAGADVNFKDPQYGNTALVYASGTGKLDVVNVLLKRPGVRLEQTNNNGMYALACAAKNGHAHIVNVLLDAGADVNFGDPQYGITALLSASAEGKLDVVNVLLRRPGIRVEQMSNNGMYALASAAQNGHADIVDRLIEAGASVALPDGVGQNCLQHAIANGHANVVECLFNRGATLPNPLVKPPANAAHAIPLSDLYLEHSMPTASIDNPLRLLDPRLLDDPDRFFQALLAALNPNADKNANWALADWFAAQGIRHAVLAGILQSLGDLSQVWRLLAAPGQAGPTAPQKLAYCAGTLSRLSLLVPDQKIAAPYLHANLSAAGVTRLSQLAIAQRDKLVALAEVVTARLASDMLDRLPTDCIARTGVDLQIDDGALKTSMINTGFVAPLAQVLVNSWRAAIGQLKVAPMAMPQPFSMADAMKLIHERIATAGARLFAQEILRQLDSQALLTQWRDKLGDTHAEGLFALFDDQCRQLREYCEQMSGHGL